MDDTVQGVSTARTKEGLDVRADEIQHFTARYEDESDMGGKGQVRA